MLKEISIKSPYDLAVIPDNPRQMKKMSTQKLTYIYSSIIDKKPNYKPIS
jgi:hypothetical protein